jgi:hypothetical protein
MKTTNPYTMQPIAPDVAAMGGETGVMAAVQLRVIATEDTRDLNLEPARQLVRIAGKYEFMRIWNEAQWSELVDEARPDHAFPVGPYWVAFDLAGLATH